MISECMNDLRMDNVNIMMLSKEFEKTNICTEVEPWFQTRFEANGITLFCFVLLLAN